MERFFKAFDGRMFSDEQACIKYEATIETVTLPGELIGELMDNLRFPYMRAKKRLALLQGLEMAVKDAKQSELNHDGEENEMSELRECPFCGSTAELTTNPQGFKRVSCTNCGASSCLLNAESSVDDYWNTRAESAELTRLRGLVAEYREALNVFDKCLIIDEEGVQIRMVFPHEAIDRKQLAAALATAEKATNNEGK